MTRRVRYEITCSWAIAFCLVFFVLLLSRHRFCLFSFVDMHPQSIVLHVLVVAETAIFHCTCRKTCASKTNTARFHYTCCKTGARGAQTVISHYLLQNMCRGCENSDISLYLLQNMCRGYDRRVRCSGPAGDGDRDAVDPCRAWHARACRRPRAVICAGTTSACPS